MRKVILLFFLLILVNLGYSQKVNTQKSSANFQLSSFKINTVKGSFGGFEGTVNFDPNNLNEASFQVCLAVKTVNSGIESRDAHLQEEEWFNAAVYPTICFESQQIERIEANQYRAYGKLSLKGKIKTFTIDLAHQPGKLTGTFKVNRLDFNVGKGTGTFTVGNTVTVAVDCYYKPT